MVPVHISISNKRIDFLDNNSYTFAMNIIHLLILPCIVYGSTDTTWDYGALGPDMWAEAYPLCGNGMNQSPINIVTSCTVYKQFQEFNFSVGYNELLNFSLTNNGHTIIAEYGNGSVSKLLVSGGNLDEGMFELQNFHLHWGLNPRQGSEHTIDEKKYSGEAHFVHLNHVTSQIAVLGFLVEGVEHLENSAWTKYIDVASALKTTGNTTMFTANLTSLMNNRSNSDNFFRYNGSLTTPPCTEGIIWTVFKTPIQIRNSDLEMLRANLFAQDFREPQPKNMRTVYRSVFQQESSSRAQDYCCNTRKKRSLFSGAVLSYSSIKYYWAIIIFTYWFNGLF
ncbi:unnamed protein product [Didymodactylos carnosus]|uniref:Carbonic anhydrase n=1 Tax=Didymodactylos carnosus TaxID=1234261 RepID=A0A814PS17_9BILA|nr:unnamed protein product [Didymodactylos carnosus]CAF1109745.1 unnamed protein product [Didymodactylos carnosus]CAF3680981.1 unnamed protein product [Didymodactylos carnosus]CAF3874259.1 unnamed protein product [Didymodactylos carnosus]